MHSLPIFVRLTGRLVILVGAGDGADAKRRLLERAGAVIVGEAEDAQLAIVVDDDAAVARLKARGVLVNAVDQSELCDFTLPAIVDRDPVLVAIGTGGASAGLAAALRQRIEAMLPAGLGALAEALHAARDTMRARWPDAGERRLAIGAMLEGSLELTDVKMPVAAAEAGAASDGCATVASGHGLRRGDRIILTITSPDPDELTLRAARLLGQADRVYYAPGIAPAILARARADAARYPAPAPDVAEPGLTLILEQADG